MASACERLLEVLRRHYEHNAALLVFSDYVTACFGWTTIESLLLLEFQELANDMPHTEMETSLEDLQAFLSRWWLEGDFLAPVASPPRLGERDAWLEWPWRGQHYVGVIVPWRDYTFSDQAGDWWSLRLALEQPAAHPGVGEEHYLSPRSEDLRWDEAARQIWLPLSWCAAAPEDRERFGSRWALQEERLEQGVASALAARDELPALRILAEPVDLGGGRRVSRLAACLRHFALLRRGPVFLHPELGAALQRELESFCRDISLKDLEAEERGEGSQLRIAGLRRLAKLVLVPLARLEAGKNVLFEARKEALQADYLLALQRVPRALWPVVARCRPQLEEWRALYGTEVELGCSSTFESHGALVVNTVHFPPEVRVDLLASFPDLEVAIDGVVIHGEALQALKFISHQLGGGVDMAFLDPPYNTGMDGFAVKDRFRRATWLTFMEERLSAVRSLLAPGGIVFASIGTDELGSLRMLLEESFGRANLFGELVWKNGADPRAAGLSYDHEYLLCAVRDRGSLPQSLTSLWTPARDFLLRHCQGLTQGGRSPQFRLKEYHRFLLDNFEILGDLCRYRHLDETGEPYALLEEGGPPQRDYLRKRLEPFSSVFSLPEGRGAEELANLFGPEGYRFECPNPVEHLERLLAFATRPEGWILDPMAGTGTTAHAVIRTNRREGSRRRFVLVEAAETLSSIVVPRIQKVMAAPEWRAGHPIRFAGFEEVERGPRLVQVLRLESYEGSIQAAAGRMLGNSSASAAAALYRGFHAGLG